MEDFKLRDYRQETDLQILYDNYYTIALQTVAHYLSGTAPCLSQEAFHQSLTRLNICLPFVIADRDDRPIGIVNVRLRDRGCKYHNFSIYLWEQQELTEKVLIHIFNTVLVGNTNMMICTIPSCETAHLQAVRNVGMVEVGCIPDHYFRRFSRGEREIWDEYTFIMKRDAWNSMKEKYG